MYVYVYSIYACMCIHVGICVNARYMYVLFIYHALFMNSVTPPQTRVLIDVEGVGISELVIC